MDHKQDYALFTDATADLPAELCRKEGIRVLPLNYLVNGEAYGLNREMPLTDFYQHMRQGASTSTAQVTVPQAETAFREALEEGLDILYIGFSSGLSGTMGSVGMAAKNLAKEYPDAKIRLVDSLSASLGEGLLVYLTLQKKKAGYTLEEAAKWCEDSRLHLCHLFTVEDLIYLHRGGRVSKTAAVAGSLLGIKPVLHVDDEGHLVPIAKVRGRKQSLNALLSEMKKRVQGWENQVVAVSHGDCGAEAQAVLDEAQRLSKAKETLFGQIGPVIGSHSGPGTVALFFLGDKR